MKKVLIITYYWPPSGGAGVQRWLKISNYLPDFGWEPIILTVNPEKASYPQKDFSLLKSVNENLKVYHTNTFELYSLYLKIFGKKEIPYGGFVNEARPGILQQLARFLRGNFFIPDPRKGWNRYAYRKAKSIIKEQSIDLIITTGPPHSSHLIGLKLKKKTGIKWLVDFRDPWTDAYYYQEFFQTGIAAFIDKRYEKRVIKTADKIITASPGFKEIFDNKNCYEKTKSTAITNGFDDSGLYPEHTNTPDDFTLMYAGTLAGNYHPEAFFTAIKNLSSSLHGLKVVLYGESSKVVREIVDELNINQLVSFESYIPHNVLLQEYKKASVLLLFCPKFELNEGIIPGKLFDYFAAGKPIIAIGSENSDVNRIITTTKTGKLHEYSDVEGIEETIRNFYNRRSEIMKDFDYDEIRKYSRRNLTKTLSDHMNLITV